MSAQYPRPVVPLAQPQSRGCAVAGVLAVTLTVVLLVVAGVWYLVSRGGLESGDFETAPACDTGQTGALDDLLSSHELEVEEPIGSEENAFGAGWQCRWATPEGPGDVVPAFATLVMVAAPNPGGVEMVSENLRSTAQHRNSHRLEGIGDEALAWTDESVFPIGCVGAQVSNLYVETCYGAAGDYDVLSSVDEERSLEGAEQLARAVVDALPS